MKIAMLFPGYSSQHVGMGKELYDEYRVVQEYFEEASNCLDTNFVKLCFASSDVELSRMEVAYPAIFLVSCATYAVLKEHGITPAICAGYNQGIYAALFAAGSISFPDGLYLLSKLTSFYQEIINNIDTQLIQIHGVSTADIKKMCSNIHDQDSLYITAYVNNNTHIVSGNSSTIDQLQKTIADNYESPTTSVNEFPIEFGLHSPLANPVVNQFKMYLEKVDFKDLSIPLVNNDGKTITTGKEAKEYLIHQISNPIMGTKIENSLRTHDHIIEIGPGQQQYPDATVNKSEDIEKLKNLHTNRTSKET